MLYDIEVRINKEYFSNGIISIDKNHNTFEGYLTNDHIKGEYKEGIINITILRRKLDIYTQKTAVLYFSSLMEDFVLPQKYTLYNIIDNKRLEIMFIRKENCITKEEFNSNLKEVSNFFKC